MSGRFYTRMDDPEQGQGDAGTSGYRSLGNGLSATGRLSPTSPLKLFGEAKKEINKIFKNVEDYIRETDAFIEDVVGSCCVSDIDCVDQVKDYRERVCSIMEVLARDHMKVVFFGRTSNGKSTTINAMLREKILPTGIGHTTNCFLQVEGSDSEDGYLLTEDELDKPKSVQSIKQLAHALSTAKLKQNSLIRILWPKKKCRLLREDVVLVDSPGIDVTPDLDLWIDKFCLDADVFVLVSNAESTLMQTEKNFFHKVSARLSKPNLFILQNRWDISVFEEDAEEVKKQHLDRNLEFLCNELKTVDKQEANERVFFVSSREVLATRLNKDKGTPTPTGVLQEGFQERNFEFANFERAFEECISKTAVRTKFQQHTERGKGIIADIRGLMEDTYTKSLQQNEDKVQQRREKADELDYLDKQLVLLTSEIKDKIKHMVEDVEHKVSAALNDEIRRLAIVVDEFERPFHPDQGLINIYKKELHAYTEICLCRNLVGRCSSLVQKTVYGTENYIIERLSVLLPEEAKQQIFQMMPKRDFEIAYRLDCRNLCADFSEDVAFRFSLGPGNLMRKLMGVQTLGALGQSLESGDNPVMPQVNLMAENQNEAMLKLITAFATLTSKSTVGFLIIGGLIWKAVGFKVLALVGGMYVGVYVYERMSWTNKARERAFKQQYVDYASSKLRLIVDLTSSNCSHQVQQELTSTFARLCKHADISKEKLETDIKDLDVAVTQLNAVSAKAKTFRNTADWLDNALSAFADTFLNKPSF